MSELTLAATEGDFPGAPRERSFFVRLPDRAEPVTVAYQAGQSRTVIP